MKHGFSLVELSIVLVILGLLTGGILAGQSLIRASELRAVTAEYQRYMSAAHTFRDKYFAFPGDMTNAVKFWTAQAGGTADGWDATCGVLTAATTGTATCNGNGNGFIDGYTGTAHEWFRFWQHLANAGLIEGTYTGVMGTAGNVYDSRIGTNVPKSKLGNAGWSVGNWASSVGAYWWGANYGNAFFMGGYATNVQTHAGVMKPEEAWNIDTKLDDGKPSQGKVWVQTWLCTNAGNGSNFNGDYSLNDPGTGCSLIFPRAF